MELDKVKLPAEVASKYDVVKPIKQLIIQKPKLKKISFEKCSLDDAKELADRGYLKEKKVSSPASSGSQSK
jgi:hypothetical protein